MTKAFSLFVFLCMFFAEIPLGWAASASLTWNRNSEEDLSGYIVYYGLSSRNYDTKIDVGTATNYEVIGLLEGVNYYFAVTAYDTSGNESTFSEEVQFVTGDLPVITGPLETIIVIPSSTTVEVGAGQQFAAVAKDAQGIQLGDVGFNWSSSNPDVAKVDFSGFATGEMAGETKIVASSNGIESQQVSLLVVSVDIPPISVDPPPLSGITAIEVSPSSVTIEEGATQQFAAVAKDAQGIQLGDVGFIIWSSSNPDVAMIDDAGLVSGFMAGTAKISASIDGIDSNEALLEIASVPLPDQVIVDPPEISIEVDPSLATILVEGSQQYTAMAMGIDGIQFDDVDFTWNSTNPIATAINEIGLVTGFSVGTSMITASFGDVLSNQALLYIADAAEDTRTVNSDVATIEINPSVAALPVGATQQYAAVVKDAGGNQISGVDLNWQSSDPYVAAIDDTGVVMGLSSGTVLITASSNLLISNPSTLVFRSAQDSSSISGGGCGFVRMKGGRPPDKGQIALNVLILFAPLTIASLFKLAIKIRRMTPQQWLELFGVWNGLKVSAVSLGLFMFSVNASEVFTMMSKAI